MGIISPLGNSVGEAVENAFAGKSGIRHCDKYLDGEYGEKIPIRVAGVVEGFDESQYVPQKFVGIFDPTVTFALAATQEALFAADIIFTEEQRLRTGVVIGTAGGGCQSYTKAFKIAFAEKKAHEIPASLFIQQSGNMPAAFIALTNKFRGPNIGLVNACASSGTAIGLASDYIRFGKADVMITGGTEASIGVGLFGCLTNTRAANMTSDPDRACRPFSLDRCGLVQGEGSGIIVLEAMEDALARRARIYGEILGDAQTNEAYHIITPNPTGEGWARAMKLAMETAEITSDDVDYISAHATSTLLGDLAETKAIKMALGRRAYDIPVSALKSMLGHTFGAAGAIETILSLAAMNRGMILPTIALTQPDPDCDLDYVPNMGREAKTSVLMKNSFGFGGTNSILVIKNYFSA